MRLIILGLSLCLFISGCGYSNSIKEEHDSAQAISQNSQKLQMKSDSKVITEISEWDKSLKTGLEDYERDITKIVLAKDKSYAVFYIYLGEYINYLGDYKYALPTMEVIAKAIDFSDFKLIDEKNKAEFEVYCDKKRKQL